MFPISKEKKKNGFTLIELMVVISIISIIAGITWANFRHSGRVFGVERDIGRMAQEVRTSLEMTMAMRDYVIPAGCIGTNRVVAYGANFRAGETLYRRMVYVIDGNEPSVGFGNIVCSEVISPVNLEQGLISSIMVFSGATSTSIPELNIIFSPPHPRTYIEGIDVHTVDGRRRWRSRRDAAEINVSLDGTHMGRVRVNRAGLIEIIRPGT